MGDGKPAHMALGMAVSLHDPEVVVSDPPKFDLDSYISNYDGVTRVRRLFHIGKTSTFLRRDALRLAAAEAKRRRYVGMYRNISAYVHSTTPKDAAAIGVLDEQWADTCSKQIKAETDRLEAELKGYKNNLIKESIRMGNEDLGAHYYEIGDFAASAKAYVRMREYCTTPKHIAEMYLKLILVNVAQDNFITLSSTLGRVQSTSLKPDDRARVEPILSPLQGLCSLASGDYRGAASQFLATPPEFMTLEPVAGITFNRTVLTANDVATYGALTALATYSRAELHARVLDSQSTFRQFLELEPHLRRAIASYCNAKYTSCLTALEGYRVDYLLDIYLHRHVGPLFSMIRRKSIVAYCEPFSRVSIADMATALGSNPSQNGSAATPADSMLAELTHMVEQGALDARIDVVRGELVARTQDSRRAVLEKALQTAEDAERAMRLRLWRAEMIVHNLEVQPRGSNAGPKDNAGPPQPAWRPRRTLNDVGMEPE